jgi:hypothetical protein
LKTKDKISDNYRKQVDELIDNQCGPDLFNPLNQEELDEIWEGISTEMDIGEVWNDISSDLDIIMPVDSGAGVFVKSIAAILIILIGLIPVKIAILDSDISHQDILIEKKQNEQSTELIIKNIDGDSNAGKQVKSDISPVSRSSSDKIEDGNKPTLAVGNRTGLTQGTPIPISNEVVSKVLAASEMVDSNLVVLLEKIPTEKSIIPEALFPDDLKKIKKLSRTDLNSLKINDNSSISGFSMQSIDRGRISGGLITLFKNTWLLNHETFDGLNSESLNSSVIEFFPDVGLSLNYSLNKTWSLQADGFFSSNTGQEYLEYYYGHYSRKKITLNYSTIDLAVKHKFIGSGSFIPRSSINVLAGGYISFLHYAHQKRNKVYLIPGNNDILNTDLQNIGSQYEKFDFGVRLGSEFELQIFNQLSLAPGLFLSIGIPNIYKGTSTIPGYLRRTHNGSAEFHLAFYYHFD